MVQPIKESGLVDFQCFSTHFWRQYPPSEFFPAFFLMIFGFFRLVEPNGEKSFASVKIEDEIRESTKPNPTNSELKSLKT